MSNDVLKANQNNSRYPGYTDEDDVPPGYRRTPAGVIPEDWELQPVADMGEVLAGKALAARAPGRLRPYLRTKNVFDGRIEIDDVLSMPMTDGQFARFELRQGDVLLNEGQSLELVGRCSIYQGEYPEPCAIQNQLIRFRALDGVSAEFAAHLFRYCQQNGEFSKIALQTTSVAHLGVSRFQGLILPWPTELAEQRAIAEALSDVDGLVKALEKVIIKKRAIRRGTMQQLLTGKTRLLTFSGVWKTKKIVEIATPCSEKNSLAHQLPVLTCSKHLGFIDSLDYFKSQVFSKNLGGYKIIKRGQIGYPANHIEEGSIGLQDLYDVALVSPIYVVFAPNKGVSSYFLHRLLKLDSYRQEFATATSSSIDRRGSLRWPAFSQIVVRLPPIKEQRAIVGVLSHMDAEIVALERRLQKTKDIKHGMLQQLLTGRTRLVKISASLSLPSVVSTEARTHSWAFNEAVVISILSKQFGTEQFPLGRKRYTKLSYLLHRHTVRRAEGYLKKAAGPYNPRTKYGGPERIAVESGYVREHKCGPYRGFIAAENVAQADAYFEKWYGVECVKWLEQFRFVKNDELEVLATVDMAAEDLSVAGKSVDIDNVKDVIRGNPEWRTKLDRTAFSDVAIRRAIDTVRRLFG